MTIPKRLEDAASRLEDASWRIDLARKKTVSMESQREWLSALTDYAQALSVIEQANNESIHEKLHQLAGHVHQEEFRAPILKGRGASRRPGAAAPARRK